MVRWCCALAVLLLGALAPAARAAVSLTGDGTGTRGYVTLRATGTTDAAIALYELVDGAPSPVAATQSGAVATAQPPWLCERSRRTFVAEAGGELSAPLTVTTPTCEHRLQVRTSARISVGEILRVTVRDRWRIGGKPFRLCLRPPQGAYTCETLEIIPGGLETSRVYRALRAGTWHVLLGTAEQHVARRVEILPQRRSAGRTILTTGDSMMQRIHGALRRRVRPATRVVSDIYVGSAISLPYVADWTRLPTLQKRADHPDAVVMSIGMGDSAPMDGATCCDAAWVAAYARRVRAMMRTYTRGHTVVAWCTVPAPRDSQRAVGVAAVDRAIEAAAKGMRFVRIVDLAHVFTPGGVFHARRHGVRVRRRDGVHLTNAGADIAAPLILRALRPGRYR